MVYIECVECVCIVYVFRHSEGSEEKQELRVKGGVEQGKTGSKIATLTVGLGRET